MNINLAKAQLQLLQIRNKLSCPVMFNDDGQHWVTISGAKVLIDGDGEVIGGAGGKLKGKSFPNAKKGADVSGVHPHDDMMTAIAKKGGLSRKEATSQGIDPAMLGHRTKGGHRLFNNGKNAMSYDQAAEIIRQYGYDAATANDLVDKVSRTVNQGEYHYTPEGWQNQAANDYKNGYDWQHEQRKQSVMEAAQRHDSEHGTKYHAALKKIDEKGDLYGDELSEWESDLGLDIENIADSQVDNEDDYIDKDPETGDYDEDKVMIAYSIDDFMDNAEGGEFVNVSDAQGDSWITVHPNGKDSTGQPVLIGEDGTIKAGMGGKFNGKDIRDSHGTKKFTSHETNAETESRHAEKQKNLTESEKSPTMSPNSTQTGDNEMNTPTEPVTVSPATEGVTYAIPSAPSTEKPINMQKVQDFVRPLQGKYTGHVFIEKIDENGEITYRDSSKYLKNAEIGKYIGKDKFKNNRFQISPDNKNYLTFLRDIKEQARLNAPDYMPNVPEGKIAVKNTDDLAYNRKDLRDIGADLINPDKHGGYNGSYYEVDKDQFQKWIDENIESNRLSMIDDVVKNTVGFDVNDYIETRKKQLNEEKEQKAAQEKAKKDDEEKNKTSRSKELINSVIAKHGKDKVLSYLSDAYLGKKDMAQKVINGEIEPNKDALYELNILLNTKA